MRLIKAGLIAGVVLVLSAGTVSYLNMIKTSGNKTDNTGRSTALKAPDIIPVKTISTDRTRIISRIKSFAKKQKGTWGIYVYETDTKVTFGLNENKTFVAASTNKIPTLIKVYDDIEAGKLSKSKKITKTASDFETGTGILQGTANGTAFAIKYLAEITVKKSDNIAHNMLIRTLGRSRVQAMLDKMKLKINMFSNTATPKSMGVLLSKLYEKKLLSDQNSKELLSFMHKTAFESRLPKYIKKEAKVYHKIGTRGTISDVGIVELEGRPYVITIYVSGLPQAAAEEGIAKLSKLIFYYEKSL